MRIDVDTLVAIIGDKEIQIFALKRQIQLLLEDKEKYMKDNDKQVDNKVIEIAKKKETK